MITYSGMPASFATTMRRIILMWQRIHDKDEVRESCEPTLYDVLLEIAEQEK